MCLGHRAGRVQSHPQNIRQVGTDLGDQWPWVSKGPDPTFSHLSARRSDFRQACRCWPQLPPQRGAHPACCWSRAGSLWVYTQGYTAQSKDGDHGAQCQVLPKGGAGWVCFRLKTAWSSGPSLQESRERVLSSQCAYSTQNDTLTLPIRPPW